MQKNPEKTRQLQRLLSTHIIAEVREQIVELLHDGADPNTIIFPNVKKTPLHLAAAYDDYNSTVEALLQQNASHQVTDFNANPLYIACVNGAVKNVNTLMRAGASLKDILESNKSTGVKPVLESLLWSCRTAKLECGHVPDGYLEVTKIILIAEERMPTFAANGFIMHTHTPAKLAKRLELNEFELLFRKKIADPFYKLVQEVRKSDLHNFLALLPEALIQEIAFYATDDMYEKPQAIHN